MELTPLWWGFLLLGLVAGTFGSLLGVGGGILMVPMLVWAFSVPQKQAQAWSLAVMIPLTIAATLRNWSNAESIGRIDLVPVGLMALAAVGGAVLGTYLLKEIPVMALKRVFAVVMVIAAVKMAFFSKEAKKPAGAETSTPVPAAASPEDTAGGPEGGGTRP